MWSSPSPPCCDDEIWAASPHYWGSEARRAGHVNRSINWTKLLPTILVCRRKKQWYAVSCTAKVYFGAAGWHCLMIPFSGATGFASARGPLLCRPVWRCRQALDWGESLLSRFQRTRLACGAIARCSPDRRTRLPPFQQVLAPRGSRWSHGFVPPRHTFTLAKPVPPGAC